MTFFSLAAVGMIATACERHPASELAGEHGLTAAVETEHHTVEAPAAPTAAAPVEEKAPVTATPSSSKFFPANQ